MGAAGRAARSLLLAAAFAASGAGTALAQKNPGTTLDPSLSPAPFRPSIVAPAAPRNSAPAYAPPALPAAPSPGSSSGPAAGAERDAEARQLADRLPLDPATANLRNRLPGDVPGTINQLGLRVPNGTATDLRNRPTTREAVIDALRH